jgi:hypothetical protein
MLFSLTRCFLLLLTATLVSAVALRVDAESKPGFAGQFRNDQMSIEIIPGQTGAYSGTIHFGAKDFPLEARQNGAQLQGTFNSQGHQFPFIAKLEGPQLSLTTGGRTHRLQRQDTTNPLGADATAPPVNPLAKGPVAAPGRAMAAGNSSGGPANYDVLASVPSGKALFALKLGIESAKRGVLAALHDLSKTFDDKPAIAGAFGDANDKQCQASFTAKLKGQPVKGTVLCGTGPKGAAVTIIYARADAPMSEIGTLLNALPTPSNWVNHPLPGGSGTIQLPSDWRLKEAAQLGSVTALGPTGQIIGLGIGGEVTDPRSPFAAQVRASGLLVAPYSDPVTTLRNLSPQLSVLSQRTGGPAIRLNNILTNSPDAPQIPGGQAAWIKAGFTMGNAQRSTNVLEILRLECYPLGQFAWGFYTSYATAPEATFDSDLPVMIQIAKSWKLNDQQVMDNSHQMIEAQNRSFAAFEHSMKERNQAFDSYMQSVRNSERVRERSNADFDEVIRGYRTVEDTQTGDRRDVNLGYSKEIVDKLNEKEGYARYKEIPLRDQY